MTMAIRAITMTTTMKTTHRHPSIEPTYAASMVAVPSRIDNVP